MSVVVAQDVPEAFPAMHFTGPAPDLGARVDEAIAEALVVAFGVMVVHTEITLWQTCSHSRDLSVSELSAPKVRRSFRAVSLIQS